MENIKLMSAEEYNSNKDKEGNDYTVDGKCSNCGGCCANIIPLTEPEFNKLRRIVAEGDMKPITIADHPDFEWPDDGQPLYDMTCPFMEYGEHGMKCRIYKQRPKVCKLYLCNKSKEEWIKLLKSYPHYYANIVKVNLREHVFQDAYKTDNPKRRSYYGR